MYAPFSQTVALFLDWQAKEMGCGLQAGRAMLAESHRLCKFHHVVDLMASVKAGPCIHIDGYAPPGVSSSGHLQLP